MQKRQSAVDFVLNKVDPYKFLEENKATVNEDKVDNEMGQLMTPQAKTKEGLDIKVKDPVVIAPTRLYQAKLRQ